ncbi:MAG: SprB repeat-containing protein [Flavobacteriales bacterium]|nr:SprB repeat-containing protein [Flavobacteriales bacterium]
MNLTHRTLTLALLVFSSAIAVAQQGAQRTKYWIGGDGAWDDAAKWSLAPEGPGGAGVPRADENVVIGGGGESIVRLASTSRCASFMADGRSGYVHVQGRAGDELVIGGDWTLGGNVIWDASGTTRITGGGMIDTRGIPLRGALVMDSERDCTILSDLVLSESDITFRKGTVHAGGGIISARTLCSEGRAAKRFDAGRSVVQLRTAPNMDALAGIVRAQGSVLAVGGQKHDWPGGTGTEPDALDVVVCGTGAGQTPFIATTSALTNFNGFNVRCRGQCNATITVNVSGGSGNFTYSWLFGGPTTQTWVGACGGPQIVVVTDGTQGISCGVPLNVTEPSPLGVIFFGPGTPPTCADVCNGSRQALPIGGVAPHTFNWNNGAGNAPTFDQLCAGTNTLEITDLNGCTFDTTFTYNLLPIAPNLTFTNSSCFGQCDGTASVNPSGGTPNYTITWNPAPGAGQGTNNATGLCAGNYTVLIVDANGCDTTLAFTIAQPAPIQPNPATVNASCFGACDGAASVAPTGSPGPFTYVWAPAPGGGAGTNSVTGLCAGNYTVLITDQITGCDTLVPITIDSPSAIEVQGTVTDATCASECDGAIDIIITGGQAPLTITWAPPPAVGQGTTNVSGLCAGPYTVTVVDALGCDTTVAFTVNAPPPLIASVITTDVTCNGACDGTATADVQGGVSPYSYLWIPNPSGGQGTPVVTGLCAGPGSVLITDANGCDTTINYIINEPPPLQVTPSQTDVTCGNLCDGTATVDVIGGVQPYTYVWTPAPNGGQGTNTATGLCAGPISVTVTDDNGCTITQDFIILDAVPILLSLQVLPASCPGVCDGSAGVIVTGGVGPYSYLWTPPPGTGQGTPDVTGLCPQAYTLTVTDAAGCDTTIAFTVPAPPPIDASGVVTDATCNGDCDGAIVLTVSGGNGVFTYVWTNNPPVGQGTGSVSALCAGTYDVTITSGACDTTLSFTVNEPPPIDASVTTTDPTCAGLCDGTATVIATGGTAPLAYLWNPNVNGQGTPDAIDLCPGNYTVTVTDASGCDTTLSFTINDPTPIVVDLVTTPASCGGGCDGTATATPSGGTGPYTYDWQAPPGGGQGTPNATDYCPGAYTLTVTDAVGCSVIVPFAISTPSGIDASGVVTDASCVNDCNGAIDVTVTGGLAPYTYLWTPAPGSGQGTPNASLLCAGNWSLQITDAAQCDTVLLFVVNAPSAIVPNESHTDEDCNGPCNGTATVNPVGAGPFTFIWSPLPPNGQQGLPSVNSLCPGIWTVVIGDASGCDTTVVFDILPKVPIADNVVWTDSPCPNTCAGTATVTPTGGIPPYTYLWIPNPPVGQGTTSVSGLCLGAWEVRVFDSVGCFSSTTFFVGTPPQFNANLITTPETCAGACTGTATVTPTGGTGAIGIDWQPPPGGGQGTTTATGLCAGTNYTVTLTDDNGCDSIFAFTVDPFTAIQANSSSTPVSCAGDCNGTATVGPTGGIAPYTYDWQPPPSGGQGTTQATGLCEGIISVTITDATGCSIVADILITGPQPILDNATVTGVACAGDCNGSIELAPSGGVAPYIISWAPVPPNGQGGTSATGLCAGTYAVNITDATGCSVDFSYDLSAPQPLVLDVTTTPSQCAVCIGTATLVINGGAGPYSITWTDPGGTIIASDVLEVANLCGGIYNVSVTDANGCTAQRAVPITDSDGEVLTITDGTTSCPNTCDGSVSVSFNCTDPQCTVAWFDAFGNDLGVSTNALTGLCPGDYLVEVTNASGCITIDTATVISPAPTTLLISSSPETCAGACDGTAGVGVGGGVPPYTFTWSPQPGGGQGTPLATGLCAGVYTVSIGDAAGCDTTAQVLITAPDSLFSGAVLIDISCSGQCDGNITLGIGGGTAPYTVIWSPVPPNGQGVTAAFALCAGDWTAMIIDANGCSITETYTINAPQPLDVSVSTVASTCPNCDGSATATVNGGTAPYSYDWSLNGATVSTDPVAIDLCGGLYQITVTDANGCSSTQVVQVADSNAEVITPTDGQSTCANNCDGVVSVSFICNAPPCNVTWTDATGNIIAQNELSVDSLCIGTYTAQVINNDGCVSFADASVLPSQAIVPNLSTTPATCFGVCDGTATVGPTGGVQPYTYFWDPPPGGGQNTPQATGLCAGVYTVTIADANLCDTVVQVLILGPQEILIDAIVDDISCDQLCDGSITAIVNGGTAPYSYVWSPTPPAGQGTPTASDLCAGDWTLTVTDANGCTASQTWTVIEPDLLQGSVSSTPSQCGSCIGTGDVVVSGGTAPYFIEWSIGGGFVGTGPSLIDLCAGIYNVLITDANLCTLSTIVVVSDIDGEVVTMTDDLVTCPGDCDGMVSVAFNCAIPTCVIAWFDASGNDLNEPSNTLSNLCAGLYLAQVTNGLGCITIDTAFVTEPDPIVPNLSTTPTSCFGVCDGTATVGPTGGQPQYTYLWVPDVNGQGTPQATDLCAGSYSVTIGDQAGCSITVDVLILEPTPVVATATVTPITCNGACDGTINVAPSGGTAPYTYAWDPIPGNGDGTPDATDLCPGDWSVTITDFNGCDTTYTFTLTDPPVLDAQVGTSDNLCFGDCNGTAQVSISGGVGPYAIVWLNALGITIASGTDNVFDLCAGDYTAVVTDANGCTLPVPFTITEGTPILANLTFTNETCFGPCDGTAAVSPTGGTGPYTFIWQPEPDTGQGTGQVTGLCAGPVSVTITDFLLCDTTITFTVLPFASDQ